jgi:integrase
MIISDATMSRHMERRGLKSSPHGFRSFLRTWLAETTDAPHEVSEDMLSHATDSGVVRAYRRADFLEQRLVLSERWVDHLIGGAGQVFKMARLL